MKNVDIVTIEKLLPLYKEGAEANAIQVARIKDLNGNSCQFNIVVGKGIYKEGDKAVYIMPDYCLPDRELFKEYLEPGGDPKKCRLGKNGRIRAIKFNFTLDNSCEPVYSNGILMPINVVNEYINDIYLADLQKELGIIKYVAPDTSNMSSGLTKGDLPYFLYATDETRCLSGDVLIDTENGKMSIKDICDNKYKGKVLSYNINTEKLEYKEIVDYSIMKNNNDWYEIELENGIMLIATSKHRIYLPELCCYRQLSDLKIGDLVFVKN